MVEEFFVNLKETSQGVDWVKEHLQLQRNKPVGRLFKPGVKYPERIGDFSKSASIISCGNVVG